MHTQVVSGFLGSMPRRLAACHMHLAVAWLSAAGKRSAVRPPSLLFMLCLHSVPLSALQRKGQSVLVTAAAGGTGQIAVQLAVMAGCHVVGTCSGGDKERLLR